MWWWYSNFMSAAKVIGDGGLRPNHILCLSNVVHVFGDSAEIDSDKDRRKILRLGKKIAKYFK